MDKMDIIIERACNRALRMIKEQSQKQKDIEYLVKIISSDNIDGLDITYMFDYIPKDEPTDRAHDIGRNLIWCFKNDTDNFSEAQYKNAVRGVKRMLYDTLTDLHEYLSDVIFVCVPASTKEKNDKRWKEFSQEVCADIEMINGFDHIEITKESVPSHYGGGGEPEIKIDGKFFKDKQVIIFDDLITTGHSISAFKKQLKDAGAKVLIGIAIAKTKGKKSI